MAILKGWRRLRVHLGVAMQTRWLKLRRLWPRLLGLLKPFAAKRYWPVYLLLFFIAFYLYGPTAGLRKIRSLVVNPPRPSSRQAQSVKIETLQKELLLLKAKLRETTAPPPAPPFNPEVFSRPVLGRTVAKFEWLQTDNTWRLHPGVDIEAAEQSNVIAAAAGTVRQIVKTANGAYLVTLDHGSRWESVYGNLISVMVQEGQKIIKGVIIGRGGASGCISGQNGVHFAIYHDGQPVDPQTVIKGL